jgi:FlgD Ig-like domain
VSQVIPEHPVRRTDVVARLETQDAASFGHYRVPGPDVVWQPVDVGPDTDPVRLECYAGTFTLQLFETPSTPTSFSGATTYGTYPYQVGTGSTFEFRAAAGAQYVAEVTLAQGAIELARDWDAGTVFASSGTFDLGALSAGGVHELSVRPVDGPQARWTIRIRALPVAISGAAFGIARARPGTVLTASYALTSDAQVTANVLASDGRSVRNLGTGFPTSRGERSLRWDGLDDAGRPVASGSYVLRLSALDATGSTAGAETGVVIDATPPRISVLTPRVISRKRGLAVKTTDFHTGVRKASLYVDGRIVASSRRSSTVVFRPRRGWRPGRHEFRVVATDSVGNITRLTRTFRVR